MIIYLAAILASPTGTPAFRLRRALGRLRRIAAAIEADDASGGTQAICPHLHLADLTEHRHTPPLELLTDHAQALMIGIARHQLRHPASVVVVDPEHAPSVAQQVSAAKDLGLDVSRPAAGRLARWELGASSLRPSAAVASDRPVESTALDSDDDQRCDRMEVTQLWQLLRCYYEGADSVCGTGAIDYARTGGGGGAYRAREAQTLVALQIAQADAVMRAARRDPRWRGLSRLGGGGGGGAQAQSIEDRRHAERRTDAVVRLRYQRLSFADISVRVGCSVTGAKRTWSRAEAAIRDALAERVALRAAVCGVVGVEPDGLVEGAAGGAGGRNP